MSLSVLVSTMHQKDYSILDRMHIASDAVVVNQCDKSSKIRFDYNGHNIIWINSKERGLSNSRNLAIKSADSEICLICDDDEVLNDGYKDKITDAFKKMSQAEIIAFDFTKAGGKARYKKSLNIGDSDTFKRAPWYKSFCSVRIAFKLREIKEKSLYFDTRFGAGSGVIASGEETVWQCSARKKGLSIYHAPINIAVLNQQESTWFSGLNNKYYYDLGACLVTNYPILCKALKYYYVINIHGDTISVKEQIKWLNLGIRYFGKLGFGYEDFLKYRNI